MSQSAFLAHPLTAAVAGSPPRGYLDSDWSVNPVLVVVVFAALAAYFWFTGPWARRQPDPSRYQTSTKNRVSFVLAMVVLVVALGPPLADWAQWYFLTAHMIQHMLLTLVVPPLLLIGLPAWLIRPVLTRNRIVNAIGYRLTRPAVGFGLAALSMSFFHWPSIMQQACTTPWLHAVEIISYLVTFTLFWWSINGPLPEWPKLPEPLQCLMLFLLMLPMVLVGAPITLSSKPVYDHFTAYQSTVFSMGHETDNQLGGSLMWGVGMVGMLLPVTFIFLRWANRQAAEDEARSSAQSVASAAPRPAPRVAEPTGGPDSVRTE